MPKRDAPDLASFADERAQARFRENQDISRQLRAVKAELGEVRADRDRLAKEHDALERIAQAAVTMTPEPDWLQPRKPSLGGPRPSTALTFLSDLHAGEVVRPEEMGGFNAFNLQIANLRLQAFFDETIKLARDWSARAHWDGIVLALGGDLISGGIHDELRETDELSVLDSTLWVTPRLLAGLEKWAEEFGHVHVVSAPGNHGRDSKVPRYKGRSAHNADTHVARMAAMAWGDKAGVTWDIPETIDARLTIYGHVFNVVHGDEYGKTNAGSAEIGMLGPVKRGTNRTRTARLAEGRPFDIGLVAHFHQLVFAQQQGFIANGSVKGYDEYARGSSFKPEPPQQAFVVIDPEHGATMSTPIRLLDRKAEGW